MELIISLFPGHSSGMNGNVVCMTIVRMHVSLEMAFVRVHFWHPVVVGTGSTFLLLTDGTKV